MDGRDDKAGQKPVSFTQRVREGAGAAWKAVSGFSGSVGRFIYNHAITVFLILWVLASLGAVKLIMYLADPCRGTTLVCPGVEWIRPGYLAEDFRNLLWAASLVFGGAGAGAALINALRRTRLMHSEHELKRSGQDAETFSRAVDQLGSEQTAIRLGAIYALEGLMRAAFADGGDKTFGRQIGETLAAFVRNRSASLFASTLSEPDESDRIDGSAVETTNAFTEADKRRWESQCRLDADVEASVAVIARSWKVDFRPPIIEARGVDLSGSVLIGLKLPVNAELYGFNVSHAKMRFASVRRANFGGTDFRNVDLRNSNFSGSNAENVVFDESDLRWATMRNANLRGARFSRAILFGADLTYANLEEAFLLTANIQAAWLYQTNFRQAQLNGAKLRKARMEEANLEGASLYQADLQDCLLGGANLESASLFKANLSQVVFDGANLKNADLKEADISGARFHLTYGESAVRNLTLEQISSARWVMGQPPKLPKGMELPHRGDGKPFDDPSPFDESWMKDVGSR